MRTHHLLALAAGALMVPAIAASDPPPPGQLTTPDNTTKATVGDAASSPMHDLNVMRSKIPPVLLQAMADPYARPTPATCSAIIARVRELTVALGDDLDVPQEELTSAERNAGLGREAVRA